MIFLLVYYFFYYSVPTYIIICYLTCKIFLQINYYGLLLAINKIKKYGKKRNPEP